MGIKNAVGPMPFGSWVRSYEEGDQSRFELSDGEELVFNRDNGFFTWRYNFDTGYLCIPKMVGNGRYWRPLILQMALTARATYGDKFKGVYLCTKRDPRVYMRVLGGKLHKQEQRDGKTYSYIIVTPEDTNVRRL